MAEISAASAAIDEAVLKHVLPDDEDVISTWENMARQGWPVVHSLGLIARRQGVTLTASLDPAPSASASDEDDESDEEQADRESLYPPETAREARRRQRRVEAAAQASRDRASDEADWRQVYGPGERFQP